MVARPLIAWASASTSLGRGKSLAGPCTGHRERAAGNGQEQWVLHTLEQASAPTQVLVCSLIPQADPAPPVTSHGAPHWVATGTPGPRRSPAEAQAQHYWLPGRHTIFQCPICSPGSSPGSRVQSSRGAVREMQLRFLSTLLRMVPTPPPLPPPPPPPLCRFRHLPPRLREPVSLSCRIRECPGLVQARSA